MNANAPPQQGVLVLGRKAVRVRFELTVPVKVHPAFGGTLSTIGTLRSKR